MDCEKCGHSNPDAAEFCSYCGNTMLSKAGSPVSISVPPKKHSEVGIASLIISVVAGLLAFVSLIGAVVLVSQGKGQSDPAMMLCGCGMLLAFPLFIIGGILGLIGLFNSNRIKTTAIVGIILNVLPCLMLLVLIIIGLMKSGKIPGPAEMP